MNAEWRRVGEHKSEQGVSIEVDMSAGLDWSSAGTEAQGILASRVCYVFSFKYFIFE